MLAGANWAAFSSIAAEVELAGLVRTEPPRGTAVEALRSWTLFWNLYDLDMAGKLFVAGDAATYFSSEKPGLIRGFDALLEHHRGFGFVPGGKNADARLWLRDVDIKSGAETASAAAIWFFDRDVGGIGPLQRGPVTFILSREAGGWRIVHAHFSNDPEPR
jgi:ketosteroid isomerase-like protein